MTVSIFTGTFIALSLAVQLTFAGQPVGQPVNELSDKVIKFIKKEHLENGHIGVSVFRKGTEIININADKKYIPASVTKLFTSLAILEHIPPGTKFYTRLASLAEKENGVLKGDLYLVGGGDSGFVSETMWFLVNAFTREKINLIEGDLVVDDSLFDEKRFDESREDNRVDRAYDAPVGAMSFNWNSVNVFLRPGHKIGARAEAFVDPESDMINLDSELKTGNKTDYSVSRSKGLDGRDSIAVRGKIQKDSKEIAVYKGITDPAMWSGANLKSFLQERGISVKGKVRIGKSPDGVRVLAEAPSKPIEQLLADMNKFSSNYVAEMLTKQLGAFNGVQGTLPAGIEIIRASVRSAGVTDMEFEIYNPSGLTRENKFTPRSLVKVLEKVRKDFRLFPEFVSSLPISGVDGTLKNRMKEGRALRWVRAKTGLLTGVNSLSGFVGLEDGEVLTFAFIYNGPKDGAAVRSTYDRLISEILLGSL
jgi:D-alanyl-D-alanine carboxypeptidase/D-alanyl-D-alanine-endopeptidase (penicillin-binding protein 4)